VILKENRNIFLIGFLAGLAFPPFYLLIFLIIGFYYIIAKIARLSCELRNKGLLASFTYGVVFGFGYYLSQLYWISFSTFVDLKTYFWLFPLALIAIPLMCSIYFGCITLLLFYILQKFKIRDRFVITIIFSILYVLFEFIRGLIFPWNLFGYILGFSDLLIQTVRYVNIYLFDLVLVFLFCSPYVLLRCEDGKFISIKENRYYLILYAFIVAFLFIFGSIRLSKAKIRNLNLRFRLVQANIPQSLKWNRKELENNVSKHVDLTISDGASDPDIIVWSESSIPYLLTINSNLSEKFRVIGNKILITGALRGEFDNGKLTKIWNSIFFFNNGDIVDYYDKSTLVPFGEYVPFSKYIPFIKKITEGSIEFSRGNGNRTINIDGIKISPVICYEIIFPNKVLDSSDPPDLIVNLTNDGWFGISSGPYQHLIAAKFRAVENKTPIIRVSNSGITAYIDEYGRIVKKIGLGKSGIAEINL